MAEFRKWSEMPRPVYGQNWLAEYRDNSGDEVHLGVLETDYRGVTKFNWCYWNINLRTAGFFYPHPDQEFAVINDHYVYSDDTIDKIERDFALKYPLLPIDIDSMGIVGDGVITEDGQLFDCEYGGHTNVAERLSRQGFDLKKMCTMHIDERSVVIRNWGFAKNEYSKAQIATGTKVAEKFGLEWIPL
jgi:hypothetical protein